MKDLGKLPLEDRNEVISEIYHLAVKMIIRKENLPQITSVLKYLDDKVENMHLRLEKYLREDKLDAVEKLYFFMTEVKGNLKVAFKPYFERLLDKYLNKKMLMKAFRIVKKEYGVEIAFSKIFDKYNGLKEENQIEIIENFIKENKLEIAEKLCKKSNISNKILLKKIAKKYIALGKPEKANEICKDYGINDRDISEQIMLSSMLFYT